METRQQAMISNMNLPRLAEGAQQLGLELDINCPEKVFTYQNPNGRTAIDKVPRDQAFVTITGEPTAIKALWQEITALR